MKSSEEELDDDYVVPNENGEVRAPTCLYVSPLN